MTEITESNKESIDLPATIQEFGFLLIISFENFYIEQTSQNIGEFLDYSAEEILGKKFQHFLSEKYLVGSFPDLRPGSNQVFVLEVQHKISNEKSLFEFTVISSDQYFVVEVIELDEEFRSYQVMASLSGVIARLEQTKCLKELCLAIVEETQRITDFDRVMIYQFDDEWNGTVVAEKLAHDHLSSFANHRFPSSDIPPASRQMLRENLIRFIPDVFYKPSPLIPSLHPKTKKASFSGRSLLRSPSTMYIDYLKNLKVGASLTISIMKNNELWGLIACQHEGKKNIGQSERFASQILGTVVSSLITSKINFEDYLYSQNLLGSFDKIQQRIESSHRLFDALTNGRPSVLDLNPVDGSSLAMCYNGKWYIYGDTPSKADLLKLGAWIKENNDQEVFATDSLQRIYPESGRFKSLVSGLLAVIFPFGENNFIFWFRPERIGFVTWTGNPQKMIESGDCVLTDPGSPSKGWQEQVRLKSVPWKKSELELVKKLKRSVIEYELLSQYKEFQILADSVDHYIWVSSPDGTPEYYNKRWMEITGLKDDFENDTNLGKHLIHPEDLPRISQLWQNSIKYGVPYTAELRIKTVQGVYQWILTRVIPAKNEKGQIIKWYGSGVNIDQIKKIEVELKDALSVRDEFISLASHELKTPITSLGLLLELSHRTLKKSNVVAPYIERSIKELRRLRYLVDELLDVSKISSGKMDLRFRMNDLTKIVIGVLERYQGERKLDHLLPKFEKMSSHIIECDEFRIEQVFTNLISNALKYGKDKPIDIDLTDLGDHVEFLIKDQGVGISKEDQGRIYGRFERVGQNVGISGLGLGLYITKNIIDAHLGEIRVESELGEGTTFRVKLRKRINS